MKGFWPAVAMVLMGGMIAVIILMSGGTTDGDVNRDGAVNMTDSIMMRRYLKGEDVRLPVARGDWNQNGRIDYEDIRILDSVILGRMSAVLMGDVNLDGSLNAVDLTMMRRNILGAYDLTDEQIWVADFDRSGAIEEWDLEEVKRRVMEDAD